MLLRINLTTSFVVLISLVGELINATNHDDAKLADKSAEEIEKAPKDYSYSVKASRVKDLAGFFESMQRRNLDPGIREDQDLVISLSEAASKLHLLMDGFPLEIRCSRYVKLIDRPNIRTFATVNLLASEDRQFADIEQNDVNLLSRIQNERFFDALGKSQTIIQSLQSERSNMRSTYETEVQIDLLNCINYYIYRHQRATLGLIEYVRQAKDNFGQLDVDTTSASNNKIVLEKFRKIREAIESIEAAEQTGRRDDLAWLKEFVKMQNLVLENNFELPKLTQDFVIEPKRLERLRSFDEVLLQIGEIKESISKHEVEQSNNLEKLKMNEHYRKLLSRLSDMVKKFGGLIPNDVREFVEDPKREILIREDAERNQPDHEAGNELESQPDSSPSEGSKESIRKEVKKEPDVFVKQNKTKRQQQSDLNQRQPKTADLAIKYITGFNGQPSSGTCRPKMDVAIDELIPKSTCTKHALELSTSLRSFDDAGIGFELARSLAESLGRFMVNCLMRSKY